MRSLDSEHLVAWQAVLALGTAWSVIAQADFAEQNRRSVFMQTVGVTTVKGKLLRQGAQGESIDGEVHQAIARMALLQQHSQRKKLHSLVRLHQKVDSLKSLDNDNDHQSRSEERYSYDLDKASYHTPDHDAAIPVQGKQDEDEADVEDKGPTVVDASWLQAADEENGIPEELQNGDNDDNVDAALHPRQHLYMADDDEEEDDENWEQDHDLKTVDDNDKKPVDAPENNDAVVPVNADTAALLSEHIAGHVEKASSRDDHDGEFDSGGDEISDSALDDDSEFPVNVHGPASAQVSNNW